MSSRADETEALVIRLKEGDRGALAELFSVYESALRRMVEVRLDQRLKGRVSASDILQDTYLDAATRLPHFLAKPEMPFIVWLRLVAGQRLIDAHRQHLGAQMRSVAREIPLSRQAWPDASSVCLAAQLLGSVSSPSHIVERAELLANVEKALESLDPIDREVLALRHFEELSNLETAAALGIEPAAASKRYIRALERLKEALSGVPGILDYET